MMMLRQEFAARLTGPLICNGRLVQPWRHGVMKLEAQAFNWHEDQQPGLGLEFVAGLAFINLFVRKRGAKR